MTVDTTPNRRRRPGARLDQGFTLIEILIVMSMLGIVSIALATVFTVIVRTLPDNEVRIDDNRTTRGLSTWLARDTTSAPRFEPESSTQGGFDLSATANACNGAGTNIVQLRWVEDGHVNQTFVANYRYVPDGSGEARIVRYLCSRVGSGSYGNTVALNLTSGLDATQLPLIAFQRDGLGNVDAMTLTLTAISGESVLVETGPRNPSEYF